MSVDLHTHSTRSDGVLAPEALCARAVEAGVTLLAITDHDVLPAPMPAASDDDFHLIPGIELTTQWNGGVVHVVGLGFRAHAPHLADGVARQCAAREVRAEKIAARLEKRGLPGALAGARALAGDAPLGRPHFARWLVETGRVRDLDAAFRLHLSDRSLAGSDTAWATLAEAVQWITADGGVAVLAHPAKYRCTHTRLRSLVEDFKSAGGAALEVISGLQVPATTRQLADLCRRFGLKASAGSDFHGGAGDPARLGHTNFLPSDLESVWQPWLDDATRLMPVADKA